MHAYQNVRAATLARVIMAPSVRETEVSVAAEHKDLAAEAAARLAAPPAQGSKVVQAACMVDTACTAVDIAVDTAAGNTVAGTADGSRCAAAENMSPFEVASPLPCPLLCPSSDYIDCSFHC